MTMGAPAATPVVLEPICNDCGIMADCKNCWKRMEPPAEPPSLTREEVAVLRREWDQRVFGITGLLKDPRIRCASVFRNPHEAYGRSIEDYYGDVWESQEALDLAIELDSVCMIRLSIPTGKGGTLVCDTHDFAAYSLDVLVPFVLERLEDL